MPETETPQFLTTKEVAALLRVRERKVYDMAAADEIPHRRITGKLLFPRSDIVAWLEGGRAEAAAERPAVASGSHDPLLDWAIRDSGAGLATLWNGSRDGLDAFAAGRCTLSGLHIPEDGGWNTKSAASMDLTGAVLIEWARRARGLLLAPGLAGKVEDFGDLRGLRVALRQPGAGAAALFDRLLEASSMTQGDIAACAGLARTESDAAAMIADGEADAALGLEAMAKRYQLAFLPLMAERYDLLIDRRAYFTPPVQALLSFARSDVFAAKAAAMGGYDLSDHGTVRWLSD